MSVVISWTKEWSSADDGATLGGADLDNIQNAIDAHYHTGGAATAYSRTFASTDLTAGVLTVTHSLGIKLVLIQIFNDSYEQILPDEITLIDTNTCSVNVTSHSVSGFWNVKVMA